MSTHAHTNCTQITCFKNNRHFLFIIHYQCIEKLIWANDSHARDSRNGVWIPLTSFDNTILHLVTDIVFCRLANDQNLRQQRLAVRRFICDGIVAPMLYTNLFSFLNRWYISIHIFEVLTMKLSKILST